MRPLYRILLAAGLVLGGAALADRTARWLSSSSRVDRMCFTRDPATSVVTAEVIGSATAADGGTPYQTGQFYTLTIGSGIDTAVKSLMDGQALAAWKASEGL